MVDDRGFWNIEKESEVFQVVQIEAIFFLCWSLTEAGTGPVVRGVCMMLVMTG